MLNEKNKSKTLTPYSIFKRPFTCFDIPRSYIYMETLADIVNFAAVLYDVGGSRVW